jgi:hypothetical protein
MAEPVPIALLVDDACPLLHVYREHALHVHHRAPVAGDGRPLAERVPNAFLDRFCDIAAARRMAGKFSIVPSSSFEGDVARGFAGDRAGTRAWLDTARRRLGGRFDFSPEMLTHDLAVDLGTGRPLEESEHAWSQHQDRHTLTPYLAHALRLLSRAGISCTGVTSPWSFGIQVEPEYQAAIVAAQREVNRRDVSWYFLHTRHDRPQTRPWVALARGPARLVAIASTVPDVWWQTIDSPRTDRDWIVEVADQALTADGAGGALRRVLDAGGWPVLLTHWQSLFSNGLETGLRALDEVGRRVEAVLGDAVVWSSCSDLVARTLAADQIGRKRTSPGGEHTSPGPFGRPPGVPKPRAGVRPATGVPRGTG